ncbi:hypothetical protein EUAN_13130 [Andreesenia angusta]|uniref:Uncharacterized protein n=1 Tax=Andreesenia angusta TaxID=39480 RepID=A0A1S1V6K6_9FIRM|nr:DUF6648 family protein [Andreesenia angusta]OHW62243.1 hypothetical protein EUAN_13130 [Andreesenia angusta]
METVEKDIFDEFFENRDSLIVDYRDGVISKKEFLKKNFNYVKKSEVKPFFEINSYEKGIYNYQYYNSIAKYYKMMASEIKGGGKSYSKKRYYVEKTNQYYHKKDNTVLKLLEHLNFQNTEAYYIEVNSPFLKDKLYEIVLNDYEFAVFHSKSKWLLMELEKAKIFKNETRKSVIDEYINEKYWDE